MMNSLIKKLDIPDKATVNKTLYKKLFYENGNLNKPETKVFTENIDKIIMWYSFTEDTINIRPYKDEVREYEEVAVIQVIINDKSKANRIGDIIQRSIQYPTIIILTIGNEIQINCALKRINKADNSKITIEEITRTTWLDIENLSEIEKDFVSSLSLNQLSFANFYRFYMDIFNRIFLLNFSQYAKDYKILFTKDLEKIKETQYMINILDVTLESFRKEIKIEDNFSKKVNLNVSIKVLEEKKKGLIDEVLS